MILRVVDASAIDPAVDAVRVARTVYRSCAPQFAAEADFLSGEGGRRHGGRWNPVGVAAVYACLTPETAMAETLSYARYHALPAASMMPRVFQAIDVALERVVDLSARPALTRCGTTAEAIRTYDWRAESEAGRVPVTQRFGADCRDAGFQGVLAPSAAAPGGRVLVWFPENVAEGAVRLSSEPVET